MTGLYVLTDTERWRTVGEAAKGRVDVIQLRDKEATARELFEAGKGLADLLEGSDTVLIINDRTDVALAVEAAGVHLGRDDLPLQAARRVMGDGIVGASVDSADDAVSASRHVDYVSIGPVFQTDTKEDAGTPVGLDEVMKVRRRVSVPVVAIGGIDPSNASSVAKTGADYVAVMSAVSERPGEAIDELLWAIEE